eukprot:1143271-Pelagomonas_calceolata.AAC.7
MSTTKGERREWLARSREAINQLPLNELFELPGRPHVVYQIRSYANTGSSLAEAASQARSDMPFLFKAFETGQIGPKRMAKMHGGKPRVATIHEYLDWTITAQSSTEDDELVRSWWASVCLYSDASLPQLHIASDHLSPALPTDYLPFEMNELQCKRTAAS